MMVGRTASVAPSGVSKEEDPSISALRNTYSSQLQILKSLFTEWSDADLLYALDDAGGVIDLAFCRISEGHAEKWGKVKKKDKKEKNKAKVVPTNVQKYKPVAKSQVLNSKSQPSAPEDETSKERTNYEFNGYSRRRAGRGRWTERAQRNTSSSDAPNVQENPDDSAKGARNFQNKKKYFSEKRGVSSGTQYKPQESLPLAEQTRENSSKSESRKAPYSPDNAKHKQVNNAKQAEYEADIRKNTWAKVPRSTKLESGREKKEIPATSLKEPNGVSSANKENCTAEISPEPFKTLSGKPIPSKVLEDNVNRKISSINPLQMTYSQVQYHVTEYGIEAAKQKANLGKFNPLDEALRKPQEDDQGNSKGLEFRNSNLQPLQVANGRNSVDQKGKFVHTKKQGKDQAEEFSPQGIEVLGMKFGSMHIDPNMEKREKEFLVFPRNENRNAEIISSKDEIQDADNQYHQMNSPLMFKNFQGTTQKLLHILSRNPSPQYVQDPELATAQQRMFSRQSHPQESHKEALQEHDAYHPRTGISSPMPVSQPAVPPQQNTGGFDPSANFGYAGPNPIPTTHGCDFQERGPVMTGFTLPQLPLQAYQQPLGPAPVHEPHYPIQMQQTHPQSHMQQMGHAHCASYHYMPYYVHDNMNPYYGLNVDARYQQMYPSQLLRPLSSSANNHQKPVVQGESPQHQNDEILHHTLQHVIPAQNQIYNLDHQQDSHDRQQSQYSDLNSPTDPTFSRGIADSEYRSVPGREYDQQDLGLFDLQYGKMSQKQRRNIQTNPINPSTAAGGASSSAKVPHPNYFNKRRIYEQPGPQSQSLSSSMSPPLQSLKTQPQVSQSAAVGKIGTSQGPQVFATPRTYYNQQYNLPGFNDLPQQGDAEFRKTPPQSIYQKKFYPKGRQQGATHFWLNPE